MRNIRLALGIALLVGSLAGCKRLARKAMGEASEALSGPSAEEQAMGSYAEGFNRLVDKAVPCAHEYDKKVPESGPEAGKKYRFFPYCQQAERDLVAVRSAFDAAREKGGDELKPVANAAEATLKSLTALTTAFGQADKYYDSEAFKSDQGVQGKEIDGRVRAASKSFRSDMNRLEGLLSALEDKKALTELKEHEGDKSYSYWFRKATYDANKLLKVPADDPAQFEKGYAQVQKSVADTKAFFSSKGADANTSFKAFVDSYDRFDSAAQRFLRSLKEGEQPERLEQGYTQLVNGYNGMVQIGNSLRQLEAQELLK